VFASRCSTIPLLIPPLQASSQAPFAESPSLPADAASQSIDRHVVLPRDLEGEFYRILKRDHEFNDPNWPFFIKIRDLVGKSLLDATFKHRVKGQPNEFDAVIQARCAVVRFDLEAKVIRVFLEQAEVQHFRRDTDIVVINNDILEIPIPDPNSSIRGSFPGDEPPKRELLFTGTNRISEVLDLLGSAFSDPA